MKTNKIKNGLRAVFFISAVDICVSRADIKLKRRGDTKMAVENINTKWTFWNVSGKWFGRRVTGETVHAGTYTAALTKAGWHEDTL